MRVLILFALVCVVLGNPRDIKVSGNKLVDTSGNEVVLHGVDRSGTEFACVQPGGLIFNGPNDQNSVDAMLTWKINAVRIPLNEDCWLGLNGVPSSQSGYAYQTAVSDFVQLFLSNNVYVILDLHWTSAGDEPANGQKPMPNTAHSINFWQSVGRYFNGNDTIIFDLFNEPFPDNGTWNSEQAWECWRDGGKSCDGLGYDAAGMQDLVNAVRSVGATNVLMLGGLAWSNSFAEWVQYLPNDPMNNLAGSWHSYNFNYCDNDGCWEQYVLPVSQKFPIIIGEMGENDCQSGYINGLMSWADQNQISYLGWTWNTWDCSSGPALISDYSGTPTEFGQGLKEHLQNL